MTRTLADLSDTALRAAVAVRHCRTHETGWARLYGSAAFGGRRISVCDTRRAAAALDVASDTGPHVIARCVSRLSDWDVA